MAPAYKLNISQGRDLCFLSAVGQDMNPGPTEIKAIGKSSDLAFHLSVCQSVCLLTL
jgi:hypothetical protein